MPEQTIPVFDGHNDVLLSLFLRGGSDPVASFMAGNGKGQLDLPRAREGGFAGGMFAIFVPSPQRKKDGETPPRDTGSIVGSDPAPPAINAVEAQRVTFAMAALLFRIERESQGRVRVCRTVGDIELCLLCSGLELRHLMPCRICVRTTLLRGAF